jgi:hypothetical protein
VKIRGKKPLRAYLLRVARRLDAAADTWAEQASLAEWPEPGKRLARQARAARREATALRVWAADLKRAESVASG